MPVIDDLGVDESGALIDRGMNRCPTLQRFSMGDVIGAPGRFLRSRMTSRRPRGDVLVSDRCGRDDRPCSPATPSVTSWSRRNPQWVIRDRPSGVHPLQQQELDPITRMLQAVTALQQSLGESPEAVAAYLEILLQTRRIPPLGEDVERLFSELREVLALDMKRQQAAGALPSWVDPEPMAALLLAVAQGVAIETTIDPEGPQHTAMASQFAQLLIASR